MVRFTAALAFFLALFATDAAPYDLADVFDGDGAIFEKLTPANLRNNSVLKAGSSFQWLSSRRDSARYQALKRKDVTFFSEVIPEAIVRFRDGRLSRIYVAVYNRGDSDPITDEDTFDAKIETLSGKLSEKFGVEPQDSRKRLGSKATVMMRSWNTPRVVCQLRWSSNNRGSFLAEYILASLEKKQNGDVEDAVVAKAAKSAAELPANVKRNADGDVYIDGIPMVDQGAKGYCVPAVVERVMKYYGADGVTQHTIAQIAGTRNFGTDVNEMYNSLKRISNRFGCRLEEHYTFIRDVRDFRRFIDRYNSVARKNKAPKLKIVERNNMLIVDETMRQLKEEIYRKTRMDDKSAYKKFSKYVHDFIDKGIPLIWCVPGHMRLIIGYNDRESSVVFSDTWGAKFEFQKMKRDDAWTLTYGLYTLEPSRRQTRK